MPPTCAAAQPTAGPPEERKREREEEPREEAPEGALEPGLAPSELDDREHADHVDPERAEHREGEQPRGWAGNNFHDTRRQRAHRLFRQMLERDIDQVPPGFALAKQT